MQRFDLPNEYFSFDENLKTARNNATGIAYIDGYHRKRAGRPRGTKQAPCIIIQGNTLQHPMQPDSTHEFLISNPLVKTFTLLKALVSYYKMQDITLQFKPCGLYITEYTQKSHGQNGYLSFFFDARYIHYYYCKYPINVCMTREMLMQSLSVLKSETHYILLRMRAVPEDPTTMTMETMVSVPSNILDEVVISPFVLRVVDDESILSLPNVDDYYTLAFKTANGTFKNFAQGAEHRFIRIQKSASTPLTISQREHSSPKLTIPDQSNNIVYNNVSGDSVLSIQMPVDVTQTFCQQSDIGNSLQVSVHPTDPISLSYTVENSQIETQYEGARGHSFPACKISILAHHVLDV